MRNLEFKHIVTLALIGLMLMSGLPLFVSEDANHDHRIDIKDAVIKLQMADYKEQQNDFHAAADSVAACENTLKAAAGLKEIVPPAFESDKSSSSNFCFLIPCFDINPVFLNYDIISENPVSFSSIISPLLHQPPIFA